MADPFRGGLFTANNALAALVQDPQQLDRARARFSESPPSYRSCLSHNSTLSQSLNPPSDEQQRRDEQKWKLIRERRASFPSEQLLAQEQEEIDRLYQQDRNPISRHPAGTNYHKLARENIKKRWVEQGIWNDEWESKSVWKWKHEEPLDPEFESNKDKIAGAVSRLFGPPLEERESKPRRPKAAQELRIIEERRRIREREREASRPYHQFIYQVSKERERIQDEMSTSESPNFSDLNQRRPTRHQAALQERRAGGERTSIEPNIENSIASTPPDINTTAYERVKNTWVRRGIWNKKWGILPGMSWKHEQSVEEMLREEMGHDPVPREVSAVEDRHEPSEAPRRPLFGAEQVTSSFSFPPFDDNSYQPDRVPAGPNRIASPLPVAANGNHFLGHMDEPLQEACPSSDPVVLPNGNTSQSSATSRSERSRAKNGEARRSTLLSSTRRGEEEVSVKAGPAPEIPRDALGLTRPSKVTKARKRNRTSTRRRPDSSEGTEVQTPLPVPDITSAPVVDSPVQPRRSRRLQEAKRKTHVNSSAKGVSSSSLKSAKPRGVVKRRSRIIRQRTS